MSDQDDYVASIVGGRHKFFPAAAAAMRALPAEQLHGIAAGLLQDWPGGAAEVVGNADAASFFLVEMYTSVPATLDAPARVTLLGDAIHAMTPTLGRGANVAVRDGALLGRALKEVVDGSGRLRA